MQLRPLPLLSLAFVLVRAVAAQNSTSESIITTVAGNGRAIRGGGGLAVNASVGEIWAVAVDREGNVYASDQSNHQIVKITPAGTLIIFAGNGIPGYSGDGGPATSASLNTPKGLAVDAAGNVLVADVRNNRIRRIDANGVISTIAGNGLFGSSGDNGPATAARLGAPGGVAVDAQGNIYIADTSTHRVRLVSPGGTITTYAGNGTLGFSGENGPAATAMLNSPRDVAVDALGNLFIADADNFRIRRVSTAGIITTVAGNGVNFFSGDNGTAVSASLRPPFGVAVDGSGNIYVADPNSSRIRRISAAGIITTVAGNGLADFELDGVQATSTALNNPRGVAVDAAGRVYIADARNGRIRTVNATGTISTLAGKGLANFSGDGVAAAGSALSAPRDVAVDAAGNLYIADRFNHRIRKVSASGVITTLAGTGVPGGSGDGGPASSATVNEPQSVTVDGLGNVYFSAAGNRVRRINPAGIISTFAGSGAYDFSGDGLAATNAALRTPIGMAADAVGNVYIADSNNHRIRRVSPAGIITTVIGNGTAGFGGDGGPATSAMINQPLGVGLDGAGNLYIADLGNNRIRKVTPGGIISTYAGGGTSTANGVSALSAALCSPRDVGMDAAGNLYLTEPCHRVRRIAADGTITVLAGAAGIAGFGGDGGPASNAVFDGPDGIAADAAGNVYITDAGNDRLRAVLVAPPRLTAEPASLSLRGVSGGAAPAQQSITISSSVAGLPWTAQASTQSGGNWLQISPASGTAPATVNVSVNSSGLDAGTYDGVITVQSFQTRIAPATVSVRLTVAPPLPPALAVEPAALTFEAASGAVGVPVQTLRIVNSGGGSLNWTARATTVTGGNWLLVSAVSGTATASTPSVVQVAVNAASLAVGTYSATITVASAELNRSISIPVSLVVSQPARILLSQRGLRFTGVAGGGAPLPQNFGVLNTGTGTMNWTAEPSIFSGGNWLTVSPASGASVAGSSEPPLVDVSVRVAGLSAGQYHGVIRIAAPTASNSPQFIAITLDLLPAGSSPPVEVRPTGLIFLRQAGSSSPGSQAVRLGTPLPAGVQVAANAFTLSGGNWLDVAPRNFSIVAGAQQALTVQPSIAGLPPGEYFGTVTLLFSDQTSQNVNVLFAVTPASAVGAQGRSSPPQADAECVPRRLFVTVTSLGNSFSTPVGYPASILAQVVNDCEQTVSDAQVTARFDNGDEVIVLKSVGDGAYQESWQPALASLSSRGGSVRVTVRAARAGLPVAEASVNGQITPNSAFVPALHVGGVVNAASSAPAQPLAPGSIISLYGNNLATAVASASAAPLPTTLADATLAIGGRDVPLFFSSTGQINAQLPFDLTPNSRQHAFVRVRRSDGVVAASVPETITIAAARPAIFTTNQQGTGQGAVLNQNFTANSAGNPEARGRVIQIFATGLGATSPAVAAGAPAPSNPPATTVIPVQVAVAGQPAVVQFSGLAPGFVGLYQVNVVVPANAQTGTAVPVVLTQEGVPSNTVTIAVQ